jgi:hypothetical protein
MTIIQETVQEIVVRNTARSNCPIEISTCSTRTQAGRSMLRRAGFA